MMKEPDRGRDGAESAVPAAGPSDGPDPLGLRALQQSGADVLRYYRALKASGRLRDVLTADVRCARGCEIVTVFVTPSGPAFHVPRYRLAPAVSDAQSSQAGREANTENGRNKWKEHANLLAHAVNFAANCPHLRSKRVVVELDSIELGSPGKPTRPRIPITAERDNDAL